MAADHATEKRIVVGVLAHVDAGKTTLCETMLYKTGEIRKPGRVDHGDSYLDGNEVERNRGITVFSKQARFVLPAVTGTGVDNVVSPATVVTVLDTPGHVDFSTEMERVLSVIDYALVIISAADGVQSHTETLWRLLRQRGVPAFVFVNKMDLVTRDRRAILADLAARLGPGLVDFSGGTGSEAFLDDVTLAAPVLMDKVLNDEPLTDEDLRGAIHRREVFPCYFGSALRMEGVEPLLAALQRYAEEPVRMDAFAARVYKIARDGNGERLTFLKMLGGTLRPKEVIHGTGRDGRSWEAKVNQVRQYSGLKYRTVDAAVPGEVYAVTGLAETRPGDAVGAAEVAPEESLEPFMTYRLIYPEGADPRRVLADLRVLEEEDPKLHVDWRPETGAINVRLMGQVQMEVLQSEIAERFGYPVDFGAGQLIYLETVAAPVEGVGHFEPLRHYAEVHLILEPAERGSGITIDSIVPEDVLARNWQRLIFTHLEETDHIGVLTGAPITDMHITLARGRAHDKHTSGGDFRQATYRALRNGLMKAAADGQAVLLEPWFAFEIELPAETVGRAMTDLRQMGGEFALDQRGSMAVLTGSAPAVGLLDYPAAVTSYTGGRGRVVCSLAGYEPCHNAAEVIAEAGYDAERDVDHPADSVFVSHGASGIVHWSEVEKYMHLPYALRERRHLYNIDVAKDAARDTAARVQSAMPAGDAELQQIFERTYGPAKQRSGKAAREYRAGSGQDKSDWVDSRTPEERAAAAARNEEIRAQHARSKPSGDAGAPPVVIIDGYNLINANDELSELAQLDINAAREQLIDRLINYQGYTGAEVIVVFDAYKVPGGAGSTEERFGVRLVFTMEREPADIRIGKMTAAYRGKRQVRVVSSDNLVQQNALGHDALRTSSREFDRELRQTEQAIRSRIK
ncbi:MAG: TetM/TetW/TetO/TetS family tetracycline resistance ribosomal protection protein [Mogibacterium sp.]|nr:TetM/TetW/TetO/TetS family tetracycline resistance ribosomal protection protein [Mogibacterium sp.]